VVYPRNINKKAKSEGELAILVLQAKVRMLQNKEL
jgi:hypothetical protein